MFDDEIIIHYHFNIRNDLTEKYSIKWYNNHNFRASRLLAKRLICDSNKSIILFIPWVILNYRKHRQFGRRQQLQPPSSPSITAKSSECCTGPRWTVSPVCFVCSIGSLIPKPSPFENPVDRNAAEYVRQVITITRRRYSNGYYSVEQHRRQLGR